MKKSLEVLLNVGYWFCYALITLLILSALSSGSGSPNNIEFLSKVILCFVFVPSLVSFYSNYLWVFPNFVNQQKWKSTIGAFSISIIGSVVISSGCMIIFIASNSMWGPEPIDTITKLISIGILALLNGILALVIKGFITWYNEVNLKTELSEKNKMMELALVKAKMDPHFLFNSLNNVDELINTNTKMASDYINKLADILRFSIYKSSEDKIPLEEEIKYLNQYIDLQKIRNNNSEYVKYEVKGNYTDLNIAPMVFIPFVENAFKYTVNKAKSNAINIKISCAEDKISFVCTNIYSQEVLSLSKSKGVGNELIKRRLDILYPNKHSLQLSDKEGVYSVNLEINV